MPDTLAVPVLDVGRPAGDPGVTPNPRGRKMHLRIRTLVSLGALVATASTLQAQNGFKAFGPENRFGFPSFYQDFNDVQLTLCFDQNDPLCGIPPEAFLTGPLVVAPNPVNSNFYEESFYWAANALMAIPGRGDAELILAVEAVFGNADEAITDGDQTVFSRLRIRLRGDGFE